MALFFVGVAVGILIGGFLCTVLLVLLGDC